MWAIIPPKKISDSFIFAHIQTKELSSAAIYLLATVVTNSYLQPLRTENEALATPQINHKNLLMNALNYI